MIHWVTPYYEPDDPEKRRRLEECREKNLRLSSVERVTYLAEVPVAQSEDARISVKYIGRRATYSDFLAVVDEEAHSQAHLVLTNSDILFTPDIERLAKRVSRRDTAIALTRRELDESYPNGPKPHLSQDLWMLKAQVIPETLLHTTNFHLGIAGCENLFAAQLVCHEFNLWNPCLDVRIYHNDPAPYYHYDSRYYGLYFYPKACTLQAIETEKPNHSATFRARKYELPITFARRPG